MFAIVRKDVMVALRTKAVVMPLIIVPLILLVGIPLLLGGIVLLTERAGIPSSDMNELQELIPPAMQATLGGLSASEAGLAFALVYLFAPMYLILPIMVSSLKSGVAKRFSSTSRLRPRRASTNCCRCWCCSPRSSN